MCPGRGRLHAGLETDEINRLVPNGRQPFEVFPTRHVPRAERAQPLTAWCRRRARFLHCTWIRIASLTPPGQACAPPNTIHCKYAVKLPDVALGTSVCGKSCAT